MRGLCLRVSADGKTRTYFLQFRVKGTGQQRLIKIGRHNDPWRVDDARKKALALKAQMEDGSHSAFANPSSDSTQFSR